MALGAPDTDNRALRAALDGLAPIRDDYQTAPVLQSFDWASRLAGAGPGSWYLVVFRSVHRPGIDEHVLAEIDERAYREAMAASEGLLVYFRGEPDAEGHCVSFCLWTSRAEARRVSALPIHVAATKTVPEYYESYVLETYDLRCDDAGALTLAPATT